MAMLSKANVKTNNLSRIDGPRGPSSGLYTGNVGLRSFGGTFTRQTPNLTSELGRKSSRLLYGEENPKMNDRTENPLGEYRS